MLHWPRYLRHLRRSPPLPRDSHIAQRSVDILGVSHPCYNFDSVHETPISKYQYTLCQTIRAHRKTTVWTTLLLKQRGGLACIRPETLDLELKVPDLLARLAQLACQLRVLVFELCDGAVVSGRGVRHASRHWRGHDRRRDDGSRF